MFRKILSLFAAFAVVVSCMAPVAMAQTPTPDQAVQCTGDPQMCAQVMELRHQLAVQKQLAKSDKDAAVAAEASDQQTKTARMMAMAATIAVILKMLISAAKSWTDFFTTDKGKAWIRISTLILGFAAFILTNVGFGISWWQALIVAGGAPGAILVHELTSLVPVVEGKKKLADVPPEPQDPQNPG